MRHLLFAASLLILACGEKPATMEDLTAAEVTFSNGTKIRAETMREQVDQIRGLMFRESLPQDRGMLFVYTAEDIRTCWTYNNKIPLDIIWLNHDHRIVEISPNTPPCPSKAAHECPNYGGHAKAQYILEVNAGVVAKNDLRVGSPISF
jgi:uncharacterized membrane protein (UPF0127 family)